MSDAKEKAVETLKSLSGVVPAALAFVQEKFDILPINPSIGERMSSTAAILAVVAGFGAYQTAKRSRRSTIGWSSLALAVITLFAILWLTGETFVSPELASLLVKTGYVAFFIFLGGAVGGFLR